MTFGCTPTEQATDLVAGQSSPGAVVLDGDSEAVGIGVVGNDEVDAVAVRCGIGQVQRARFFGVGERHGGEITVGVNLFLDHHWCAESCGRIGSF